MGMLNDCYGSIEKNFSYFESKTELASYQPSIKSSPKRIGHLDVLSGEWGFESPRAHCVQNCIETPLTTALIDYVANYSVPPQ